MDKQEIDVIYKYIIHDVLLPSKNVHLINLEEYNENGVYAVSDRGYRLRVLIESTYDLVNFMKPIFAVIPLIRTLNKVDKNYRQFNEYERAFMAEMQSIEQALLQGNWLLKESECDKGGILKTKYSGRIEEFKAKQGATPAIVDKSSFEKVLHVSSEKTSSIVLYDTFKETKLPIGIGFEVIDDAGEELFVVFYFHTFNGLFNYLSAMINVVLPSNLNVQHPEIAVAQELLRVNDFLKKVGVIEVK